jgi:sulfite reductase (NADPH) flavoprotein alpha-component
MSFIAPRLPDNAPFSPAQRAWLDGYIAGILQSDGAPTPAAAPQSTSAVVEDLPWHDASLSLEDRLKLAEGRPKPLLLMAAMAQQDCGQCGYLCRTYAEAIADGRETSLSKCVPGGKATTLALKELASQSTVSASTAPAAAPPAGTSPATRSSKAIALLRQAAPLNREGSEKDTRHVVLDIDGTMTRYRVGDSLGILASNGPELVEAIIRRLGGSDGEEVECADGTRRSLADALTTVCDVGRPSDQSIEVLASRASNAEEGDRLQALAEGYPGAQPADADLLELLEIFPSARPPIQELVSALNPLQPRLYSIASSPKVTEGEVHLTVAAVRYRQRDRLRMGIASTFLADRARPGSEIPVFIQPSNNFNLPKPEAPMIMIGPGTGVAPFRAFLQERRAVGAAGRNWLFFGDQRRAFDYLYEEEIEDWHRDGLLARLDLAFSRDQADKLYVQHRMRENSKELWAWLQDGAHVYVCGDAQRMAKDVDTALVFLIAKHGQMDWAAAKAWLANLGREGRYQRDVY